MASRNAWPDLIGHLVLLKQQIDDLDPDGPRTYMLPRIAATEQRLARTERLLGQPLDPGYREFLTYADGWSEFSISIQLLGTSEQMRAVRTTAEDYLEVTLEAGFQEMAAPGFDSHCGSQRGQGRHCRGSTWLAGRGAGRLVRR